MRHSISLRLPTIALLVLGPVDSIEATEPAANSTPVTNQPPVCSAAQTSPSVLWAPNHQFVPIAIIGVTDPDEDSVTIAVTRAASVRAERPGNGNGRVYHISFTAHDGHGSSCSAKVTVGVPHSRKKGLTAIDDGQLYNSTLP